MTIRRVAASSVLLALLLWLALVALAGPTRAAEPDTPDRDPVLAEALFDEGLALMNAKRYVEACPKLAESHELDPSSGGAFNLAQCYQLTGRTATAWATFREAEALARKEGRLDRVALSREGHEGLKPKLTQLVVEVPQPHRIDGLEVRLDGKPIRPALWGVAMPLDPGAHTLEASAPGRVTWRTNREITGEGHADKLVVPLLESSLPPPPPPVDKPQPKPKPAAKPRPTKPPPVVPEESGELSPLVPVGFAVAGAGVIVGAVTGLLSLSAAGDVSDTCDDNDVCPTSSEEDADRAITLANVSNVSFAVAGAGVILGIVGVALSGDDSADGSDVAVRGVAVRPLVGLGFVGVAGRF